MSELLNLRQIKTHRIKIALIVALAALTGQPALAHSGSGQPFIFINGEYVKSNPLAGSDPTLAQDLAPARYLANRPIDFAVDSSVFGAPGYHFRWRWGKNDTTDGAKVAHSFLTTGTRQITLQLQNGDDPAFNDISTIDLNIVPKPYYITPTAKVTVEQIAQSKGTHTVRFRALPSIDPSTSVEKYNWKFADGATGEGQTVEHIYTSQNVGSRLFPTLRVQDKNSLYTDLLFELDITSQSVVAVDSLIPGIVSHFQSVSDPMPSKRLSVAWVGVAICLGGLSLYWLRKRRAFEKKSKSKI